MAFEKARAHLDACGVGERTRVFDVSSATVELAAAAAGVAPACIAKTLAFLVEEKAVLIVAAGDAKVDNAKYKACFQTKARMLSPEQAIGMVGHAVGGVCPFGIPGDVAVYLDISLKRFERVYPAVGSDNSVIELTLEELYRFSNARDWIDVCKNWDGAPV